MKFILPSSVSTGFVVVLTLISSVLSEDDDCATWPESLKSLHDCCEVPVGPNPVILNYCYRTRCAHLNETENNEQAECGARCFANMTLLLNDDGEMDKNIVKRIYNIHATYSPEWLSVINETVDNSCDFGKTRSIADSFAVYFDCINSHLEKNCASFVNSLECDHVQEHFEKCKNISSDCSKPPESLISDVDMCCIVPKLFSKQIHNDCRAKCHARELFHDRQVKCVRECMFAEANIRSADSTGDIDFEAVKAILIAYTKNNSLWFGVIEKAVGHCGEKNQELITANTTTDIATRDVSLLDCLKEKLSENCVEFEESAMCNKVKRFKMSCPDATKSIANVTQQQQSFRSSRSNSDEVGLNQQQSSMNEDPSDTKLRSLWVFTAK